MLPLPVDLRIGELKERYSDVYVVESEDLNGDGLVLLARPLSFSEFISSTEFDARSEVAAQEFIVSKTLDSCYNITTNRWVELDDVPVGCFKTVATTVFAEAGYGDANSTISKLNEYRQVANSGTLVSFAFVMKAFPQYKLVDIKNFSHDDLMLHVTLAEIVLGTPFQITQVGDQDKSSKSRILHKIEEEARINTKYMRPEELDADNKRILEQGA